MTNSARLRFAAALALGLASADLSWAESPMEPDGPPGAGAAPTPDAKPAPAPGAEGSSRPPVAPDTPEIRAEILKDLYDHLSKSKDPDTAAAIASQIERLWFVSGSDTIDLLMQRALQAMGEQKLSLALDLLTAVTELQPDYAEGWNRRALVYFRMSDMERALGDLRRALALEPHHYKALEGVASVLREAGSKKQALEALRKLIEMHPFMPGVKEAVEELSREVEGQGI